MKIKQKIINAIINYESKWKNKDSIKVAKLIKPEDIINYEFVYRMRTSSLRKIKPGEFDKYHFFTTSPDKKDFHLFDAYKLKLKKFLDVSIGDEGYDLSYNYVSSSLQVFEGIVYSIEIWGGYGHNGCTNNINMHSKISLDEDTLFYYDYEGYDYLKIKNKCYAENGLCQLWIKGTKMPSWVFARDKKEYELIKAEFKKRAIEFATKDFD